MSLFKGQEKIGSVYHADDSDSTKISTYPQTADFTIKMNIIRRGEDFTAIMGQDVGNFVANVNGSYTNADQFKKSDKVVWNSAKYIVTNNPKKNRLFDRYKIILRSEDNVI